jgi:hypothetical protein
MMAVNKSATMIELADWILHEQARFCSSVACNDLAVKAHVEQLKAWEREVRLAATQPDVRAATKEECAKISEQYGMSVIAKAIRALPQQSDGEKG